jgi:hypothetical protein
MDTTVHTTTAYPQVAAGAVADFTTIFKLADKGGVSSS